MPYSLRTYPQKLLHTFFFAHSHELHSFSTPVVAASRKQLILNFATFSRFPCKQQRYLYLFT